MLAYYPGRLLTTTDPLNRTTTLTYGSMKMDWESVCGRTWRCGRKRSRSGVWRILCAQL